MSNDADQVPLISVVTPSLNQAPYLETCLRSVIEQGYPRLEYLVIDGGSTDGSVEIIRRHADRLAYWVSEPDRGQADAINKGFRRARGTLVTWLNADDFLYPGALAVMARHHAANPDASFYFAAGDRVDVHGRKRFSHYPAAPIVFDRDALITGLNYILQPACFINRQHLMAAGYLDESLHYGLDTDLWIRLAARAAPVPVTACVAASREYAATKTATGAFERAEELRRIAARHSGDPMTPGALWYYLQTLHAHVTQHPERYPLRTALHVARLWIDTEALLTRSGRARGIFPLADPAQLDTPTARWQRTLHRAKLVIHTAWLHTARRRRAAQPPP